MVMDMRSLDGSSETSSGSNLPEMVSEMWVCTLQVLRPFLRTFYCEVLVVLYTS